MPEQRSGWSREFDEPIAVPDSGKLVTLRDAADYITAFPDEEAALPEWQAAIEALMLVAVRRPHDVRPDRHDARLEPSPCSGVQSGAKGPSLGTEEAQEGPMTVWIYVDASKQVGDRDHLKVFASEVAADTWLEENDPEGVAFEYDVLE
jgi:hypothetical protein